MKKRSMMILLAVVLSICIAGFVSGEVLSAETEEGSETTEVTREFKIAGEKPVIGWVETRFNHPWRVAQMDQFNGQMEKLGVDWDVTIIDGNNDPNKQSSDIEDLIAKGCDIIMLSPVTSEELAAATKKVRDAHIPMIIVDRYVAGDDYDYAVEVDNTILGVYMAEQIVKDANGEEVDVICMSLPAGSSAQIDQDNGFESVIADHPNIHIVATYDTKGDRQTAMEQAEASLVAYPDAWYYTQADEIAFGVEAAAQLLDRSLGEEGVHIYTANHSKAAIEEVRVGNLMCVVTTPLCAIEACNLVNDIINGNKPAFKEDNGGIPEIIICESDCITKENAADFVDLAY